MRGILTYAHGEPDSSPEEDPALEQEQNLLLPPRCPLGSSPFNWEDNLVKWPLAA